jgi:hypothetical protein
VTTRGALADFIEAQQPGPNETTCFSRPPAQRQPASQGVARELEDAGI